MAKGVKMNTTNESVAVGSASISGPKRIWLLVVGFLLVGTYASMFIPAFAGQASNPMSAYGSMLWNGLFFYLWWKRRGRNGWHGALLGVFVGVLAFTLSAFVRGFVGHA